MMIEMITTESESSKFKARIKRKTPAAGNAKDVAVPLKYLINFWRALEMLLINCEMNLILTWSAIVPLPIQQVEHSQ